LWCEVAFRNFFAGEIGAHEFDVDAKGRIQGESQERQAVRMRDVEFQGGVLCGWNEKGFASGMISELEIRWSAVQVAGQELAKNSSRRDKCATITRKKESICTGRFVRGQGGRKAFEDGRSAIETSAPDVYIPAEQAQLGGVAGPVTLNRHPEILMHAGR
jgi:hypothetical protein